MGASTEMPSRKPSAELLAILAVGITVLLAVFGQAAWLDRKIERFEARLSDEIRAVDLKLSAEIKAVDAKLSDGIKAVDAELSGEFKRVEDRLHIRFADLQQGQAAIRERLAAVESRVATVPASMQEQAES